MKIDIVHAPPPAPRVNNKHRPRWQWKPAKIQLQTESIKEPLFEVSSQPKSIGTTVVGNKFSVSNKISMSVEFQTFLV